MAVAPRAIRLKVLVLQEARGRVVGTSRGLNVGSWELGGALCPDLPHAAWGLGAGGVRASHPPQIFSPLPEGKGDAGAVVMASFLLAARGAAGGAWNA